jgi:hypothetical protein
VAVPFRRPAVAEIQSLLRRLLRAHHAALALLALAWLIGRLSGIRGRLQDQPRRILWIVVALTLLTFLSTSLIANFILERIPHVQDSITYFFQGQTLARGRLWAPAPPAPDAFDQEFLLVRKGRWFGKYPPGFPLLLALGVRVGVPWLVNPLLATLTIPLLYALGCELYDRRIGLLAALLGATSPFFLFLSGSYMSHSAELFWLLLTMVCWIRSNRSTTPSRYALVAGGALGMAFLTRQVAAITVGAAFIGVESFSGGRLRSRLPQLALVAALSLSAVFLLLGYQWAVTGKPFEDPRLLYWPYDRIGFGPETGNNANLAHYDAAGEVVRWYQDPDRPPAWHTPSRGLRNLSENLQELEVHLYGWLPIVTLAFVWLLFLLTSPARSDWVLFATTAGLAAAHLSYWAHGIMYGPRYYYAVLPALVLLTARGIQTLAHRVGSKPALTVLALLISSNLLVNIPYQTNVYRGYNFVSRDPLDFVTNAVETPALVLVAGELDNWWEYGALFAANTPWLDGPIIVARDPGASRRTWLIDHFPGRQVYLLDGRSLLPITLPG